MKKIEVHVDSRNRVCLTKVSKKLAARFYAYEEGNKIILEPLVEVPASEAWLFEPQNKEILKMIKEGLKQEGTINYRSLVKSAGKSKRKKK